jgi:galactose-1-phosphate uridylyltransferase
VLPRLAVRAGFEMGTGVEVNTYPPERAAAELRDALGSD